MAKSKPTKRRRRASSAPAKKSKSRRGGGRGGKSILQQIVPTTNALIMGATGGAGYVVLKALAAKFLPASIPVIVGQGGAAIVANFAGNMFLNSDQVGAGAIGALTADVVVTSGILAQIGLSDYVISDYLNDRNMSLPAGNGRVMLQDSISHGHHHHHHHAMLNDAGGAWGQHYGQ